MYRSFKLLTLFILIMISASAGLCQEEEKKESSSLFKSTKYENNQVGLIVTPPSGWILYPTDRMITKLQSVKKENVTRLRKKLKELENKKDSKEYKKTKKALEELEESAKYLRETEKEVGGNLSLFRAMKDVDNSQVFITCRAISTDTVPQVKTGKDYLSIYLHSYNSGKNKVSIKKQNIGGKRFDYFEFTPGAGGSLASGKSGKENPYRIYCTVVNKYILLLTCTFPRGKESQLDEFLGSMSFR